MLKTKKVIIVGAGGMCIDILDTLNELNAKQRQPLYACIGFLDDDKKLWNKVYHGVKVLGPITKAKQYVDTYFVNGIGNAQNFLQKESISKRTGMGYEHFISLVHPTASVSKMATIGRGTVVLQNVTIASGVTIGNEVLIMAGSVINHDVTVGDYTYITAGVCVSGLVTVGSHCYLGTNSSIMGKITIGDGSIVGMGSVVLKSIPTNSVYVGNPAKFLRKTS